ncbi:MAG: dipeptidyl peptidase 3 [Planctomycetes bacterium]|nr:dipeptidyl peptidase 3 [Planctomycetota bacterium]
MNEFGKQFGFASLVCVGLLGCSGARVGDGEASKRKYLLERVDDVGIVQVYADGFTNLNLDQKRLVWHLYRAAVVGRDIYLRQRCEVGPEIRDLLEELLTHPDGVDPITLENVRHYALHFWVDNSPYNNITARKNVMAGSMEELAIAADVAEGRGARFPKAPGESVGGLVRRLGPWLFDPDFQPMVTVKTPEAGKDPLEASACTFYGDGVKLADFEGFTEEFGLNSTVVKDKQGHLHEQPWRLGDPRAGVPAGLYAKELGAVVDELTRALPFAPEATRRALEAQIRFYRTGLRADREAYDIAWVADKDSVVDTVNSFVEVYVDPRGVKGAWEGIVSYEDPKKAALIKGLAANAQWFENHMPYEERFRKPDVRGISARSIDVIVETGDAGPVSAIGINLPNDAAIRESHGSKSVSLANIVEANTQSSPPAARDEFCWDADESERAERWVALTNDLLTNMHEVIGHASGRQADDKPGDPAVYIKENYSALEEARADLVALWFMGDAKLKELGLLDDPAAASRAAYENYVRNGGLQQLRRMAHGDQLEEDHMRNRLMVVRWIQANSKAIEERERDGKHFLRVVDADAFREVAGKLLALVQRIKSTGDYAAAKELFDTYGVRFDPALRDEVIARYAKLDVPAYVGFVFPRLTALRDSTGAIVNVTISYPLSLETQMLEWSGRRAPPTN